MASRNAQEGELWKGLRAWHLSRRGFRIIVDYCDELPNGWDLRNWRLSQKFAVTQCLPAGCITILRTPPGAMLPSFQPRTFLPSASHLLHKPRPWSRTTIPGPELWRKFTSPRKQNKEGEIHQLFVSTVSCIHMLLFRCSNICHYELKQLLTNSLRGSRLSVYLSLFMHYKYNLDPLDPGKISHS